MLVPPKEQHIEPGALLPEELFRKLACLDCRGEVGQVSNGELLNGVEDLLAQICSDELLGYGLVEVAKSIG